MKLYRIERTISHLIVILFCGAKISIRIGYTNKKFCKYLKKYTYLFDNLPVLSKKEQEPNYIWQIWLQGEENMPEIVKKCLESVRVFNSDKKVIFLSENDIEKYVNIPDFIMSKYKKKIIPPAHFTDYVRLCLLSKYGGTWIDATVMLSDKIPKEILSQEVFFFKNKTSECKNFRNVQDYKKAFLPMISNWFIHSKPNNLIILTTLKFLNEYWKRENSLKHYFLFHYFITFAVLNNSEIRTTWDNMLSLSNDMPHFLQNSFKTEFAEEKFDLCIKKSFIHKLTYRFESDFDMNWIKKILSLNFEKDEYRI